MELQATVHRAVQSGVDRGRIVIDPGLGFGKRKEQNFELIARLPQLSGLLMPILVGPSRKSFLARTEEHETSYANAAAVTASILNGAHIVRVHEALEMRIAAQIADAILNGIPEPKVETQVPRRSADPITSGTVSRGEFPSVPRRSGESAYRKPDSPRPPFRKPDA